MPHYFLGVDGGQSSTTAYIGDDSGSFMGGGSAGPCNHVRGAAGKRKFVSAVRDSVKLACEVAKLDPGSTRFEAACLGFSGGAEDKRELARQLIPTKKMAVTHDAETALLGATAGEPGIALIAGTGSMCYGQNAAGKTARAGGWGYLFGDEGGALDITKQALRAALRYEEGWGPKTQLRDSFLTINRAKSANELMHRFYKTGYPRSRIASNAPLVDDAAKRGDEVAREILNSAAQQLATYTAAVRDQLFKAGEAAVVAYIGGVFRSLILRERFRMLVEFHDGNVLQAPVYEPAAGALLGAYRLLGLFPEIRYLPNTSA